MFWYFPINMPSLAAVVGTSPLKHLHGISNLPTLLGQTQDLPQSSMYRERPPVKFDRVARHGNWSALKQARNQRVRLFDVMADPAELFDVADAHPDSISEFEAYFASARTESV